MVLAETVDGGWEEAGDANARVFAEGGDNAPACPAEAANDANRVFRGVIAEEGSVDESLEVIVYQKLNVWIIVPLHNEWRKAAKVCGRGGAPVYALNDSGVRSIELAGEISGNLIRNSPLDEIGQKQFPQSRGAAVIANDIPS